MRVINYTLKHMGQLDPLRGGQNFHAVHVAGTNGKTSVCYYLSNMLNHAGVKWGRFTSPHPGQRSAAIVVNGRPLTMAEHQRRLDEVLADYAATRPERVAQLAAKYARDEGMLPLMAQRRAETDDIPEPEQLDLSPFEADTAVALREFDRNPDVAVAVVEAGMGGWQDATNVLSTKALTVITQIGIDHTEYLGDKIEDVAMHKARIMRDNVPCIIARTTLGSYQTLQQVATFHRAPLFSPAVGMMGPQTWMRDRRIVSMAWPMLALPQIENLSLALLAYRALAHRLPDVIPDDLAATEEACVTLTRAAILGPQAPGRMHGVLLPESYGRKRPIFVDGAHNKLGFDALRRIMAGHAAFASVKRLSIVWIVSMSAGPNRDPGMLRSLMRPHDRLAAVEYEKTGDDVPDPFPAVEVVNAIHSAGPGWKSPTETALYLGPPRLADALRWAVGSSGEDNMIVVTGSLYLTNELMRLVAEGAEDGHARK